MLSMLRALPHNYEVIAFVHASSDVTSLPRAIAANAVPPNAAVHSILRNREVSGSHAAALLRTCFALYHAARILSLTHPDLILCNGPGTCLPVILAATLRNGCFLPLHAALRVALSLLSCGLILLAATPRCARVVFVESVARVTSLSLTGRIVYHARLAHDFHVQWPQLEQKYPRTHCVGLLT